MLTDDLIAQLKHSIKGEYMSVQSISRLIEANRKDRAILLNQVESLTEDVNILTTDLAITQAKLVEALSNDKADKDAIQSAVNELTSLQVDSELAEVNLLRVVSELNKVSEALTAVEALELAEDAQEDALIDAYLAEIGILSLPPSILEPEFEDEDEDEEAPIEAVLPEAEVPVAIEAPAEVEEATPVEVEVIVG
jgi:multidrug efflux pump subunit AcrA (membrane-fusion protein)